MAISEFIEPFDFFSYIIFSPYLFSSKADLPVFENQGKVEARPRKGGNPTQTLIF